MIHHGIGHGFAIIAIAVLILVIIEAVRRAP